MIKLCLVFVSLLATLSYASPGVVATRGGPPNQDNVCRPSGIDKTIRYFLQSASIPTKVWQAEGVNANTFSFVDLQPKTNVTSGQALNNQLWAVQPINNGDSFAIVSAGPTATICANGDGGPLDSLACDGAFTAVAAQSAQFFLTCTTCADQGKGATNCQIQSALEGQCASFLDDKQFNTIKLDDCSSKQNQPHQFWNIVPEA